MFSNKPCICYYDQKDVNKHGTQSHTYVNINPDRHTLKHTERGVYHRYVNWMKTEYTLYCNKISINITLEVVCSVLIIPLHDNIGCHILLK